MFNLVSDFLSRRKKPLPHCGFADALPRGNLRDGKTVQIVQNHHLAVSAGQEGDAAEDFRQTLGVAAVLVRRLIGQPRERLLGVAVIEQRGPAGAAGAGVGRRPLRATRQMKAYGSFSVPSVCAASTSARMMSEHSSCAQWLSSVRA